MKDFEVDEKIKARKKYSVDGEFNEPLVMCDSCQELIFITTLHKNGMCPECGSAKVRNIRSLQGEKLEQCRAWVKEGKLDPDWLALFSEAEGD